MMRWPMLSGQENGCRLKKKSQRIMLNYKRKDGKNEWEKTSLVGSFKSNGYGLYDIVGNGWDGVKTGIVVIEISVFAGRRVGLRY